MLPTSRQRTGGVDVEEVATAVTLVRLVDALGLLEVVGEAVNEEPVDAEELEAELAEELEAGAMAVEVASSVASP